jgi:hypothetical protein
VAYGILFINNKAVMGYSMTTAMKFSDNINGDQFKSIMKGKMIYDILVIQYCIQQRCKNIQIDKNLSSKILNDTLEYMIAILEPYELFIYGLMNTAIFNKKLYFDETHKVTSIIEKCVEDIRFLIGSNIEISPILKYIPMVIPIGTENEIRRRLSNPLI